MKAALFSLGLIQCLLCAKLVQAQTSSGLDNTIQNSGLISPNRLDTVRPVRQQNFFIDSGTSSQQFFRDGRDSLYLLPAENTKPILKIDETSDIPEADQKDIKSKEQ